MSGGVVCVFMFMAKVKGEHRMTLLRCVAHTLVLSYFLKMPAASFRSFAQTHVVQQRYATRAVKFHPIKRHDPNNRFPTQFPPHFCTRQSPSPQIASLRRLTVDGGRFFTIFVALNKNGTALPFPIQHDSVDILSVFRTV